MPHTGLAYSIIGLIYDLYNNSLLCCESDCSDLVSGISLASCIFAFAALAVTSDAKVSPRSSLTPRYLVSFFHSMSSLKNVMGSIAKSRFLVNRVAELLETLALIRHFLNQGSRRSSDSCTFLQICSLLHEVLEMAVSSAYM